MNVLANRLARLEAGALSSTKSNRCYLLAGSKGFTDSHVAAVVEGEGFAYTPRVDLAIIMIPVAPPGQSVPTMPLRMVQDAPDRWRLSAQGAQQ